MNAASRLGAAVHGIQVGVQDKVPFLVCVLMDFFANAGTGIVIKDIDLAEGIDRVSLRRGPGLPAW